MIVMNPFVMLISTVLKLVWCAVFIWFVLSLLLQFNIVNRGNPIVSRTYDVLERLVNPMLKPIRRYLPTLGGIDFSPMVLILGLEFLRNAIFYYGM
jgi:YggT family protein